VPVLISISPVHQDADSEEKKLTTEDAEDTEKTKETGKRRAEESENFTVSLGLRISGFISLLCVLRVLCGSNFLF